MLFTVSSENHNTPINSKRSIIAVDEDGTYSYHSDLKA
jgi:hypothetical protein